MHWAALCRQAGVESVTNHHSQWDTEWAVVTSVLLQLLQCLSAGGGWLYCLCLWTQAQWAFWGGPCRWQPNGWSVVGGVEIGAAHRWVGCHAQGGRCGGCFRSSLAVGHGGGHSRSMCCRSRSHVAVLVVIGNTPGASACYVLGIL
jgi:hypothetical protein